LNQQHPFEKEETQRLTKGPVNIVISYSASGIVAVQEELQQRIRSINPRINVRDLAPLANAEKQGDAAARQQINALLAEAEIYCGFPIKNLTKLAPKLKWIQAAIAGINPFLTPELLASSVILTKAGIHDRQISENIFNYILMLARRSLDYFRAQEAKQTQHFEPVILHRKTLGILGLGNIGRRVARLGKVFGMKVIATRTHPEITDPNVDLMLSSAGLPDLLRRSDFVVNLLPLTPETKNVIGEEELRSMKRTAFIINVGRGDTIDEPVLVRALKEEWIAGAALDVFSTDPGPPPAAMFGLKNLILTPHVSGPRPDYAQLLNNYFCRNLRRYLRKEPLMNLVDKQRGY